MGKKTGKTAPRRKRDRTPMVDMGTPELQAKRRAAVGFGRDGKVNDTTMSGYPLGVLYVRQLLTRDQHDAGVHFANLAKASGMVRGAVTAKLDDSPGGGGAGLSETAGVRVEANYRDAVALLKAARGKVFEMVLNVAVLEDHPYAAGSVKVLRQGLDILDRWHKGQVRARRRERVAA